MKSSRVVITLSSGEVIEKISRNQYKLIEGMSKDYPQWPEYKMLQILGLTSLVKGYIVTVKTEPL